jgi:hypothetical protein
MFFHNFALSGGKSIRVLEHRRTTHVRLIEDANDTPERFPRYIEYVKIAYKYFFNFLKLDVREVLEATFTKRF